MKRLSRLSKKGVSPLIATVILIAFAVALGAVVMNWGSTHVGESDAGEGCEGVKVSWFERSGHTQVCYSDTQIIFTIESNNMDVSNLKVIVDGEHDIELFDDVLKSPLNIADIKKISIPYSYSKIGKVIQIKAIPKLELNGKLTTCPSDSALVAENPERC